MPAKASAGGLKNTEINPAILVIVVLAIVVSAGYFLWLRPQQAADKAAKDWVTPEAAAARAPENRPKDPAHEALVQQLIQKERGSTNGVRVQRRRDEN